MTQRAFLMGVLSAIGCFGQFYPTGAHVNLYFPHLADGGASSGQWQTSLEFVNPSPTLTAHVEVRLYGDEGFPLNLDFGAGPLSLHTLSIPPSGAARLRSTIASDRTVTGQAMVTSDVPVQGTVLFRSITNTVASLELSAPPTLPSTRYTSLATRDLGVAVANISTSTKTFQISAADSSGTTVSTGTFSVPALGHKSFNLSQVLTDLPADFSGSAIITPQIAGDPFVAWTLNVERNVISTLPAGSQEWPVSHADRIQLVYKRILGVAPSLLAGLGNNLSLQTAPNLVISPDLAVNVFASSQNQTVQVNLALSELVSDSPSELAFLVAHALAHIAQFRGGALTVLMPNDPANREPDADLIAMILVLRAGFDPYGAAGAIGKLNMANGSTALVSPFFDNLADGTTAFSAARMNSMLGVITSACGYVNMTGYCAPYKTTVHPHFPGSAPL